MAILVAVGGTWVECTCIWLTGSITVQTSRGVATVGPGPAYYPVGFADVMLLAGPDGVPHAIGALSWGQGIAGTVVGGFIPESFLVLGGGGSPDPTRPAVNSAVVFNTPSVTDHGDGLVQVSY